MARGLAVAALLAVGALAGGCTTLNPLDEKGFIDPTEMFPNNKLSLQKPILTSLAAIDPSIDDPEDQFYGAQAIQPMDRQVQSHDYRIVPGDVVVVSVSGLQTEPGLETTSQSQVSESGNINLRLIPPVRAEGLTEAELQRAVADAYRNANILSTAQVSVQVAEARGRSFSVLGAVNGPGQYFIQKSDFRVLDALVLARDTLPSVDDIYVVRQVKEDPNASAPPSAPGTIPGGAAPGTVPPAPGTAPGGTPAVNPPAPGTPVDPLRGDWGGPPLNLMQAPAGGASPATQTPGTPMQPGTPGTPTTPMEPGVTHGTGGAPPGPGSPGTAGVPNGSAVYTPAGNPPPSGGSGGAMGGAVPSGPPSAGGSGGFQFAAPTMATETRVIRVPLTQLRSGVLEYNIVIRPGDLILCPQPVIGEYYMGGHVLRTGVYSLSARKITLKQAVISAGMFDGLAIPERTELYRRIGAAREAFVRIDIDAIFSGTQPDLFLKPNDVIQVGTNALAPFIAAIRQGFRITYGFGFLYDRNYAPQQGT
jgi:polysaccharide export outer membrane protein